MGGTVPLSDHEQRQLEQIEQALYADHPRLARLMRARDPKIHYRRRVLEACVGFLLGAGALVAGLFLKYAWLSAAGFVLMLLSGIWAIAPRIPVHRVSYRNTWGAPVGFEVPSPIWQGD